MTITWDKRILDSRGSDLLYELRVERCRVRALLFQYYTLMWFKIPRRKGIVLPAIRFTNKSQLIDPAPIPFEEHRIVWKNFRNGYNEGIETKWEDKIGMDLRWRMSDLIKLKKSSWKMIWYQVDWPSDKPPSRWSLKGHYEHDQEKNLLLYDSIWKKMHWLHTYYIELGGIIKENVLQRQRTFRIVGAHLTPEFRDDFPLLGKKLVNLYPLSKSKGNRKVLTRRQTLSLSKEY